MSPDLADLNQLKAFLRSHGLEAKKSLGQNFLVNADVLDHILDAADLSASDLVVEVGPGPGVLSQRIVKKNAQLLAVEIDAEVIPLWQEVMSPAQNASILNQDVLEFDPPEEPYKLVANIPYYITSPILKHFLRQQSGARPQRIVLMIQKEVAERVCSQKKPSLLSWEIRIFGEPRMVCTVPSTSFYPAPKVDSAVLCIDVFDRALIEESRLDDFFRLLQFAYKQPRKTLMNNLLNAPPYSPDSVERAYDKLDFDDKIRPHQLSFEDWDALEKALK